jgi:hypothetical protein
MAFFGVSWAWNMADCCREFLEVDMFQKLKDVCSWHSIEDFRDLNKKKFLIWCVICR